MPNDDPLFRLSAWLQRSGYRFVTVTPATHARVNSRPGVAEANSLQDVFGWSRAFRPSPLPQQVLTWLERGDALEYRAGLLRSQVRFSTLGDSLYMHTMTSSVIAASKLSGSTAQLARRALKPVHTRVSGNVRRLGKRWSG